MRKSGPIQLENGSMSANIESYCKLLSLSSVADNYEHMAMDATKQRYHIGSISTNSYSNRLLIELTEVSMPRLKKQDFPI